MTEDTVDLSKGKTLDGDSIENPKSDTTKVLGDTKPVGQPIENYDERSIGDTLEAMHHAAVMAAANAKGDGVDIYVSELKKSSNPLVFDGLDISMFFVGLNNDSDSDYAIYRIGS